LDEETGLYYFGARYYDPRTNVWQSTDPVLARYMTGEGSGGGVYAPQNLNLFAYVHNRPVVARDPDGKLVNWVAGAVGFVAGGVIGGGVEAGRQFLFEENMDWGRVGATAAGGAVGGGLAGVTMGGSLLVTGTATVRGGVADGTTTRLLSGQEVTPGTVATDAAVSILTLGVVRGGGAVISATRGALPHGFANSAALRSFTSSLSSGLERAGFGNTRAILQGSAVTERSFRTGEAFDVGRVSDFDVALAGPEIFARARDLGIGLRSGGTRTGPLTSSQLQQLGLSGMEVDLSAQAGRPVNFMIYESADDAIARTTSRVLD
jgi:RHS repeat-associated protein